MSRSSRAALAAAIATLTSAACGGPTAPGTTDGPAAPVPTATEIAGLCDRACDHVAEAGCSHPNPECAVDCRESFSQFPKACQAALASVFTCYAKAVVQCGDTDVEVPSCAETVVALQACVDEHAELDPTYGGRRLPTSSTPEHSAERCGELPETPKLYECTGGPPKAGCVADPHEGADLYCCPA